VLRLSPKRWYAGLFGQQAWLAHGADNQPLSAPAALQASATMPQMLEALLQAAPPKHLSGKLSVMLPSHAARSVSLPWSANLHGDDEKQAYAFAHLEQAGLTAGDSHVVHAEFRHFGARGLGYAVPRQLLDELHAVAARHKLELTTVLPVGAIAHLAARRARGIEIYLVAEEASVSALTMDRTGLQRYDAEPAVGGQRAALRRLLTRLSANAAEFNGIFLCADHDEEELAAIASAFAGQGTVQRLKSPQWRRYL